jgi:hypothetical protein
MYLSPSGLRYPSRRGTVAVFVAVCLTVLLGIVAIALDGGLLLSERRHAQAVADSAALAATCDLYASAGADKAVASALSTASANGYSNDGTTSVVTVNIPPKSGDYIGQANCAEVLVTFKQPRSFSAIFGSGKIPVTARAVARTGQQASTAGLLILDPSRRFGLSLGGGASATITAPVIVNSTDSSAVDVTGGGNLQAPEFDITGDYTATNGSTLITTPAPNNINVGVAPTPDPLAYLPEPTRPPNGTITKAPLGGGNFQYTLTPGSYTNLPSFNAGDAVVFKQASSGNDGIYYLTAGGFTSTGANLLMDPTTTGGIMLFNAGTGTNDKIDISGNSSGTVNLSGLSDGLYAGLTFFQTRSGSEEIKITGSGQFSITGTIYSAAGAVQVSGGGGVTNIGSQYVTKDLWLQGKGTILITYDPKLVARARFITLVE